MRGGRCAAGGGCIAAAGVAEDKAGALWSVWCAAAAAAAAAATALSIAAVAAAAAAADAAADDESPWATIPEPVGVLSGASLAGREADLCLLAPGFEDGGPVLC